jgi:limonene-1,2-epoxide hydrolase
MTNEEVMRAVFEAWEDSIPAAQEAMRTYLTDDCVWDQPPVATTKGGAEAAELLAGMSAMGFQSMAVDLRNVVAAGDLVFTERVDWMVKTDGSRLGPLPVVGVAEFRDGKISAWREYFDSKTLEGLSG